MLEIGQAQSWQVVNPRQRILQEQVIKSIIQPYENGNVSLTVGNDNEFNMAL